MSVSSHDIDMAIRELKEYQMSLERKVKQLAERLATMGATKVSIGFSHAIYDGPEDHEITVEQTEADPITYQVRISGSTVLFIEFGTGVTYQEQAHPQNSKFGMGPGTYPLGVGHWNDPRGWWFRYPNSGGSARRGNYKHTYGNPANAVVYNTGKDLRGEIERVAREVFGK